MLSLENSKDTSGGVSSSNIDTVNGISLVKVPFSGVPGVIIISSVGS